jgi:hypothetical protein
MFSSIFNGPVLLCLIKESYYFGYCCRDIGDEIAGEQIGSVDYDGVDSEDRENGTEDVKETHGKSGNRDLEVVVQGLGDDEQKV